MSDFKTALKDALVKQQRDPFTSVARKAAQRLVCDPTRACMLK